MPSLPKNVVNGTSQIYIQTCFQGIPTTTRMKNGHRRFSTPSAHTMLWGLIKHVFFAYLEDKLLQCLRGGADVILPGQIHRQCSAARWSWMSQRSITSYYFSLKGLKLADPQGIIIWNLAYDSSSPPGLALSIPAQSQLLTGFCGSLTSHLGTTEMS